ncbi:hypothetical protein K7X08_022323 [Anisodus acutangulus]|uniref:PAS domain-containing protein n=1 Tax=Anisodus acutangulus TaxID=402998 RepID=A0A9Q1MKW8_9SOLA|nr:hypothetical protein K7X08_022323 [Anisodus acutangulus]
MDNTKASAQGPTSPAEGAASKEDPRTGGRACPIEARDSMGQAVHVFDVNYCIIYWNRTAEQLYGYSAEEALGQDPIELLPADDRDFGDANNIVHQVKRGKSWTGLFPASKVSNKVKPKIKTGESSVLHEGGSGDSHYLNHAFPSAALSDHKEDSNSIRACTPRGDVHPSPFGLFANLAEEEHSPGKPSRDAWDESEGKQGIYKIITSKAEERMAKKSLRWPWKDNQLIDTNCSTTNETSGFWSSSFNVDSTSSSSSCGSTSSSAVNKEDMDTDCPDYEILWEDLIIGKNIGEGSCGTVYHGMWYGSDVAVKVFSKQEYSDEVIYSFKQEVSLMKRPSTSKYSSFHGCNNFTSTPLHCHRVPSTVILYLLHAE